MVDNKKNKKSKNADTEALYNINGEQSVKNNS